MTTGVMAQLGSMMSPPSSNSGEGTHKPCCANVPPNSVHRRVHNSPIAASREPWGRQTVPLNTKAAPHCAKRRRSTGNSARFVPSASSFVRRLMAAHHVPLQTDGQVLLGVAALKSQSYRLVRHHRIPEAGVRIRRRWISHLRGLHRISRHPAPSEPGGGRCSLTDTDP